ncbi:hypothetical protein EVAR_80135_1 [Eumeta japonica]|uniref:Uncharacterized protein n=1 Tax=Eumeta variegata TaxID=151549 RepID=A0A4C1YDC2_EUMVA|nr:hypothetical protein EVAR_80135_1 [Eumeta japonica]
MQKQTEGYPPMSISMECLRSDKTFSRDQEHFRSGERRRITLVKGIRDRHADQISRARALRMALPRADSPLYDVTLSRGGPRLDLKTDLKTWCHSSATRDILVSGLKLTTRDLGSIMLT